MWSFSLCNSDHVPFIVVLDYFIRVIFLSCITQFKLTLSIQSCIWAFPQKEMAKLKLSVLHDCWNLCGFKRNWSDGNVIETIVRQQVLSLTLDVLSLKLESRRVSQGSVLFVYSSLGIREWKLCLCEYMGLVFNYIWYIYFCLGISVTACAGRI